MLGLSIGKRFLQSLTTAIIICSEQNKPPQSVASKLLQIRKRWQGVVK